MAGAADRVVAKGPERGVGAGGGGGTPRLASDFARVPGSVPSRLAMPGGPAHREADKASAQARRRRPPRWSAQSTEQSQVSDAEGTHRAEL